MRRGGRSRKSSRQSIPDRESARQTISRPPNYNPRRPVSRPPTTFRSLSGTPPTYNRNLKGRTPKTSDMKEEEESE